MPVTVIEASDGPFYPNGVTTRFPFAIKALSPSEIAVGRLVGGNLEIISPASFSVDIAVDREGGTVIFPAPPPMAGGPLFVLSEPFFGEETLFEDEGPFNSAVLNPVVDRSAVRAIYLRERVRRSIQAPFGQAMRDLPGVQDRALKVLGFDYEGQPVALAAQDLGFDAGTAFDGGIDEADDGIVFLGGIDG